MRQGDRLEKSHGRKQGDSGGGDWGVLIWKLIEWLKLAPVMRSGWKVEKNGLKLVGKVFEAARGRQAAKQIKQKEWLKGWGNERVKSDGKASLFTQAESWIPVSTPLAPDQPCCVSVWGFHQAGSLLHLAASPSFLAGFKLFTSSMKWIIPPLHQLGEIWSGPGQLSGRKRIRARPRREGGAPLSSARLFTARERCCRGSAGAGKKQTSLWWKPVKGCTSPACPSSWWWQHVPAVPRWMAASSPAAVPHPKIYYCTCRKQYQLFMVDKVVWYCWEPVAHPPPPFISEAKRVCRVLRDEFRRCDPPEWARCGCLVENKSALC